MRLTARQAAKIKAALATVLDAAAALQSLDKGSEVDSDMVSAWGDDLRVAAADVNEVADSLALAESNADEQKERAR